MDLYGAVGVKGVVIGDLLVRRAHDISLSRRIFCTGAARSGRQGWPKVIAQRLALDGREHSARLAQSGRPAASFPRLFSVANATIPRGARHRARVSRHELVFGRPARVATTMQSCASAGKLRGGGPILNRGAKAIVQYRVAATSDRRLQCEHRHDARRQQLKCGHAAGRSARPTGASPVVANRHSTTRSLRANATIIVLRAPRRASAVRRQYHAVSGLAF